MHRLHERHKNTALNFDALEVARDIFDDHGDRTTQLSRERASDPARELPKTDDAGQII